MATYAKQSPPRVTGGQLDGDHATRQSSPRTRCRRGHRLAGLNVYRRPSRPGWRECLVCKRAFAWQARRAWFGLPARPFEDAERAIFAYFPELADDARDCGSL